MRCSGRDSAYGSGADSRAVTAMRAVSLGLVSGDPGASSRPTSQAAFGLTSSAARPRVRLCGSLRRAARARSPVCVGAGRTSCVAKSACLEVEIKGRPSCTASAHSNCKRAKTKTSCLAMLSDSLLGPLGRLPESVLLTSGGTMQPKCHAEPQFAFELAANACQPPQRLLTQNSNLQPPNP